MSNFLWSLKNGELEEVRECVEKGQDVNEFLAEGGRYPLHYASDGGHTKVVDYLVSKGADINKEDKHGITPVLAAIYEGHSACVQLLIQKGAKIDGSAPDGSSYMDCAETDDMKSVLQGVA